MSIYHHVDYRAAIKTLFDREKEKGHSLTYTMLAEALGVQKTFVSKVLLEQAHFNEDHLFLLSEFFRFSEKEKRYIELLFQHSRSGLARRQTNLLSEIKRIQEESRQTKEYLRSEMQNPETDAVYAEYYLEPMNLVVHAYLSIGRFGKDPSLLKRKLGLTDSDLAKILSCLERSGIIAFEKNMKSVRLLKGSIHLDSKSIYCSPHQLMFRIKNMEHISKLTPDHRFVFNITFSADPEVRNKIQEDFLKFSKQVQQHVENSEATEVFQISFDLFSWSLTKD